MAGRSEGGQTSQIAPKCGRFLDREPAPSGDQKAGPRTAETGSRYCPSWDRTRTLLIQSHAQNRVGDPRPSQNAALRDVRRELEEGLGRSSPRTSPRTLGRNGRGELYSVWRTPHLGVHIQTEWKHDSQAVGSPSRTPDHPQSCIVRAFGPQLIRSSPTTALRANPSGLPGES